MAYAEKVYKVRNGKQTKQYTWRARYKKPDGTWGSEPGFPTRKLAEAWGDAQEAAIREGRWVDPEMARKKFGDFVYEWMAAQKPRGRTTMNRWERLEAHILPKWKDTPLVGFNWFDVEAWAREVALTTARSTVRDCVQLMTRILNGAVDKRYLSVNPLAGRRLTGLPADVVKKKSDEEQVAEPEAVLQLGRRLGPIYGLHVITAAWTGLRWEELVGLHRRNTLLERRQKHDGGIFTCPIIRIDPDEGVLAEYYVRDEAGKRQTFRALEPPKNAKSARDVDVPPFLAVLLEKHLADWPHEFVFTTAAGKWWWRSHWHSILRPAADGREARPRARGTALKEAWEPIMPGLTMRDLRHTHDSWQEEIDVRPVLGYEQMGHKYPGIKGTYRHPTPPMRIERLAGLQGLYERAMRNLGWETIWEG
ncbi:integrase [Streptomyces glaucescens]